MTKYRISELDGALLDAVVHRALLGEWPRLIACTVDGNEPGSSCPRYSRDGTDGHQILDREHISTYWDSERQRWAGGYDIDVEEGSVYEDGRHYDRSKIVLECEQIGPTRLVAGLRAFLRKRFGEEVDLP